MCTHYRTQNFKFRSNENDFEVHFSRMDVYASNSLAARMVRSQGMKFVVDLLNHGHEISVNGIRNCNLCMIQKLMDI